MKNRGFTLLEVIGSIVIISFIALLVTPAIIRILKEQRENTFNRQIELIEQSARNWGAMNHQILGDGTYLCTLDRINNDGFLESATIKDPRDQKKNLSGCIEIKYIVSQTKYTYTFKELTAAQITAQCKCEL